MPGQYPELPLNRAEPSAVCSTKASWPPSCIELWSSMLFMASATGAGAHPKPPDNVPCDRQPPVLRADPEVAEALHRRVGVGRREQAGVQGRQYPDGGGRAAAHGLASGNPQQLLLGDAVLAEDAGALRGGDHGRAGRPGDRGDAVEVVEVRVADKHEVGPLDLRDAQARPGPGPGSRSR